MNHEIATTSKNQVSQWRLKVPSPLMGEGEDEGESPEWRMKSTLPAKKRHPSKERNWSSPIGGKFIWRYFQDRPSCCFRGTRWQWKYVNTNRFPPLAKGVRGIWVFFLLRHCEEHSDVAISTIHLVILRSPLFLPDDVRISSFKVFMKKKLKRWDPHALKKRGLRMTD